MELLDPQMFAAIEKIFGAAAASDFLRTLAIFSAAAWVHSRTVSKTIRTKIDELILVFQADHDKQKIVVGELGTRVTKIEEHLSIPRGE